MRKVSFQGSLKFAAQGKTLLQDQKTFDVAKGKSESTIQQKPLSLSQVQSVNEPKDVRNLKCDDLNPKRGTVHSTIALWMHVLTLQRRGHRGVYPSRTFPRKVGNFLRASCLGNCYSWNVLHTSQPTLRYVRRHGLMKPDAADRLLDT